MQGGCLEPKVSEPLALDEQNRCIRKSHPCGCIVTDGSSPKHNNRVIEPIIWDGFNQRIRADSQCVGTITQNVGADLKRNGQGIIEPKILERFYANREPRVYDEAWDTLRSERTGLEVVEPMDKYDLSDTMKRYINSYNDKYKVSDGNLTINDEVAVAKTTREGCTRADSSDYISADMEDNKNIAGMDCVPYSIRKLTPKECWRLMGFTDEDVDKAVVAGISNAQLYKQSGNSIVVQVLEAIFGQML
jgi:site-specific DNA-cytosine methylase